MSEMSEITDVADGHYERNSQRFWGKVGAKEISGLCVELIAYFPLKAEP